MIGDGIATSNNVYITNANGQSEDPHNHPSQQHLLLRDTHQFVNSQHQTKSIMNLMPTLRLVMMMMMMLHLYQPIVPPHCSEGRFNFMKP